MTINPNDKQVGGQHYKKATFQPWDWELKGAGGWQQSIVKYVVRYRDKNGLQDLEKAQHYLEKLLFHAKKHEVYNQAQGVSLSDIESFCDQNDCNQVQRRAIQFTLMWKCVDDILAAARNVTQLIEALQVAEEENAELFADPRTNPNLTY